MDKKKPRIYLAAPIFAEWNREYNEKVAQRIEQEFPNIELYVPQRNQSINNKKLCATAEQICEGDFTNNLDHDDIVVALVDGDTPGIGTVVECSYFARMCEEEIQRQGYTNKTIISLYTDTRECSHTNNPAKNIMLNEFAESQYSYLNLLLVGVLKRYGTMCASINEVLQALSIAIKKYE